MSPRTSRRQAGFLVGFLVVALVVAGGLSYFASSHPDGLDTVALEGCQVTETPDGEQLDGSCIAQNAGDHPLSTGPFADYGVGGDSALVGVAGVVGVLITLVVAGALFWLLRRRGAAADGSGRDAPADPPDRADASGGGSG